MTNAMISLGKSLCSILVLLCVSLPLLSQSISPLSLGLNECQTPTDRYRVLLRTHQEALAQNTQVDYSGISELHIEIPKDAVSIPLSQNTDFKVLSLVIGKNNSGKTSLLQILDKVLNKDKGKFQYYDFNIEYRKELFSMILTDNE